MDINSAAEKLAAAPGVIMLIGGLDTGKTHLATKILRRAARSGMRSALVDADVSHTTVGPPACAGLKFVNSDSDVDHLEVPDRLHFVGTSDPSALVLQQVVAAATLTDVARRTADLVVVDTSGAVAGVIGESLKYHEMELCRPDRVTAIQRGTELEPLIGMLKRFFDVELTQLEVDPGLIPASPDDRAADRAREYKEAFAPPLEKWRVRPTVFAPTLPTGLELIRLDGVLVGIQDGQGRCVGLGRLEYEEGALRVLTSRGEGMQGLRLGSMRIDLDSFSTKPVNLREVMFGL